MNIIIFSYSHMRNLFRYTFKFQGSTIMHYICQNFDNIHKKGTLYLKDEL